MKYIARGLGVRFSTQIFSFSPLWANGYQSNSFITNLANANYAQCWDLLYQLTGCTGLRVEAKGEPSSFPAKKPKDLSWGELDHRTD